MERTELFISKLKFNDWWTFRDMNEDEAIQFVQGVANTMRKTLYYQKNGNDFNVFLKQGLKDSYQEQEENLMGFIEPFDEWKDKYFKVVKP